MRFLDRRVARVAGRHRTGRSWRTTPDPGGQRRGPPGRRDARAAGRVERGGARGRWTSLFSERTRGRLSGAWIEPGGRAVIDLADFSALVPNASTSTGARRLLSELTATAFQFAEVTAVEYRFDGSCAAFWAWLGGTCHADRRPG